MTNFYSSTSLLVVLTTVSAIATAEKPMTEETPGAVTVAQAVKVMRDLEKEWRDVCSVTSKTESPKLDYGVQHDALNCLLKKIYQDKQIFQRTVESALKTKNADFSALVLAELVFIFTEQKDRDGLVKLLSRNCPDEVSIHLTIEGYLIVFQEQIDDGMIVLCDAYDNSNTDDVKKSIVRAMRRGFSPLGIHNSDDRQFIKECRTWYTAHKNGFEKNLDYGDVLILNRQDIPLFVPKKSRLPESNRQ